MHKLLVDKGGHQHQKRYIFYQNPAAKSCYSDMVSKTFLNESIERDSSVRFLNSVFFLHKLAVHSPLIHTLNYFHHLLRFHRVIGL